MQGFLLFPCFESQGGVQGGQAEVSLNKVSNWAALQALVKDIDSVVKNNILLSEEKVAVYSLYVHIISWHVFPLPQLCAIIALDL